MYQKVIIEFDKLQISIIKSEISPFYLYLEKKIYQINLPNYSLLPSIHLFHQFNLIPKLSYSIQNPIPSNSPPQESTQHRTRVQRIKIDSNYSLSIHA